MYFNSVGQNLTLTGSQGSGPSAGGSIIFQVAPAGSAGTTAQNALATALQVNGNGGITGQDGATANTLALRNGTAAQAFRVYNTYDGTNDERGFIKWSSNVLQIGTDKTGTGTARNMEFQTDGTTRLTISVFGPSLPAGSVLAWAGRAALVSPADGIIRLRNANDNDFDRLQFGGTTSSFPAIKRSSTTLQARLADDSAFASVQGKLTTDTAYTAGDPTTTGYLVVYDSAGTAYKIPAVAV
jgi:hypothetical protein